MKVSVIIPTRLAVNPVSPQDNLYLDLAIGGVIRQTASVELEIIVGLDAGALVNIPPRFLEPGGKVPLRFVESTGTGQAKAVNAAAAQATGDVIAFCEDDDLWEAVKLDYQLPLLERFDLLTCNQRERTQTGEFVRFNNFATPSGWVMKRETWTGFNETFRFHVDTEWLGRANAASLKRVHLLHDGCVVDQWVENVRKHSAIMKTDGFSLPLVHRTINPNGGMGAIGRGGEALEQSIAEHRWMYDKFGNVPW